MALKTIQSPGIQVGELDRSRYDAVADTSLPNSPWCFLAGFADKGHDYEPMAITSRDELAMVYGYPQTEAERYFWNGCVEVLDNGGKLLAAKLPYDNRSRDKFAYVDYKIARSAATIQDGAKIAGRWKTVNEVRDVLRSIMAHADLSGMFPTERQDEFPVDTLPQMRQRVRDIYMSDVLGPKLSAYSVEDMAAHQRSFVGASQDLAKALKDPLWTDDGSVDGAGARGVWSAFQKTHDGALAEDAAESSYASAMVVSQWEAACQAAGIDPDQDNWMAYADDGVEQSLSVDVARLASMFDAILSGRTDYVPGISPEDGEDLGILSKKMAAALASPEFAPTWPDFFQTVKSNQPITTVVELRTAIQRIVAAIDSAHPFTDLAMNDSAVESYVEIIPDVDSQTGFANSGMMSIDELDDLLTGSYTRVRDRIRIVDISRTQYSQVPFECVKSTFRASTPEGDYVKATNEILGIVPVVVAPTNALYFQNLIEEANPDYYNCVADFKTCKPSNPDVQVVLGSDQLHENLYLPLKNTSADDPNRETLSRLAAKCFPAMEWADSLHYDQEHFKKIGIVVCQAFVDNANGRKINFQVLESFVGSLDPDVKADDSGTSAFIDNVVNSNSKYVRVFSSASQKALKEATIVACRDQTATSLGFYRLDCFKKISAQDSVLTPLKRILDNMKDIRGWQIDLVLDAGLTNVAQYLVSEGTSRATTPESLPKWNSSFCLVQRPSRWWAVAQIYDVFCKNTRKDCMFLLDSPRPFCLTGEEKIVRRTRPTATVANSIVPRLKHLAGVNSSYSAGYCTWFKIRDAWSGETFWCPPSIKIAGVYIRTDVYGKKWDAPAGINRGKVSALDVAFSPTNEEAGQIYQQCWNYAVSYPLGGIVVEGQKTFQRKATALDRVNVRRLMLHLEKEATSIAKYFLYEGNTAYMRSRFVNALTPIFEKAVNGYGISDYRIRCDDTNNTSETIDRNELHCQIAVRPVKSVEFIKLNFIVVNQTANIDEEVSSDTDYSLYS